MDNMELWNKVARPPKEALKQIKGGRLSGMTDISPQWRYKALTEIYGPCGVGWKYEITRTWSEAGADNQICAFATIRLFIKDGPEWSSPIDGIGGSMLVAKEKNGPHTSDECYKMAVTDAISVACKMLGVGADIYSGSWDGSKYKDAPATTAPPRKEAPKRKLTLNEYMEQALGNTTYPGLTAWYKENLGTIRADLGQDGVTAITEYCGELKQEMDAINAG